VTVVMAMVLAGCAAWLAMRPSPRASRMGSLPPRLTSGIAARVRSRQHRARGRQAVREALAEVVADMRAGQPPARALSRALAERAPCPAPRTYAASRWGGDVVESLQADSRSSGQPVLAAAAACWSVASAHGAGLADSLDRVVQQDRRAEEVRRQLEAHLAAPRATARMLALLPLLGLGLGIAVGGDPLGWLLRTAWGWGCLIVGLGLTVLGLAWAGRIVSRTERLL
jgi:tight adherence protein B